MDRTQRQSADEIRNAQELSLEPTRPPSQVPGYKFQRFLGSGAFGEVWSATSLKTGRRVAIKFYTGRSASDVRLLASEVEKLVVLAADRYVVQLLDVGWDADPPFYVMDFIEHGSLEDRLKDDSTMPAAQATELFQELANGMMHLHDRGILHCDLKPGNVLLDQDGKPRVADFGQSRLSTEETAALGTLFYMAPEQASLDAVPDATWDVYGLGALLFRMLTGEPPYYSPDLAKRIDAKTDIHERLETYRNSLIAAETPHTHRDVPGVDRALSEIIDRCIAADPKKRFANIQSLMLALRQRELAKARRPVMFLGLVAPILLITVMSFFGGWAARQSINRTQEEITDRAIGSNEFASQLAARSAAKQIDDYFRVVYQLSKDPEFLSVFDDVIKKTEDVRLALADPQDNATSLVDPQNNTTRLIESNSEIGARRDDFKSDPVRKQLQPFLENRLWNRSLEYPSASSWFVCDRFGNQIASAFRTENTTLGNNYSYRTYFAGTESDLKIETADGNKYQVKANPEERTVINRPHLSAVFLSEQSNKWKIAFATPIVRNGDVEGIVAVTVELGNLVEFENYMDHYAMLVDSREGENEGVILEHPLFTEVRKIFGKIPDELIHHRKIDVNNLPLVFSDPVGETKIGKTKNYDGKSIVAKSEVTMKDRDQAFGFRADSVNQISSNGDDTNSQEIRKKTGLVVLTVENYASIETPSIELSQLWGRLALFAVFILLMLIFGMWLFVRKMLQESKERLERSFSPTIDSTSIQSLETLADDQPNAPVKTLDTGGR